MSSSYSNEIIVKQMCSGALSGGLTGLLFKRGQYLLSYLTLTSIGALDFAYHFNYIKTHLTHLTYENLRDQRPVRSRFHQLRRDIQRDIQRELRDPNEELDQEIRWLFADFRRHVDQHIYFGMGFTISFLISFLLVPKGRL